MKIPIVNEQDEIIGYKDRKDRNTIDITRIIALWLWNEKREALLAQRAFSKNKTSRLKYLEIKPEIFLYSLKETAEYFFNHEN